MTAYRSGDLPAGALLGSDTAAAAYAAYRMPATAAAVAAALRQVSQAATGWAPASLLDVGAGTGAAAWAATAEIPSVRHLTLLEQAPPAIALGHRIAAAGPETLQAAQWQVWRVPADLPADVPPADLATVAYLLGELDPDAQQRAVALAAAAASTVVIVEPGTPTGYRRILAARQQLIDLGRKILAPCPHGLTCPLAASRGDWCHFAARVDRSVLHRRIKGAERSFEDEKFAFVAAGRDLDAARPQGRVLRRPQRRKGLVSLRLCTPSGEAQERLVSRRQGPTYRAATDVAWGDAWLPGPYAAPAD